MNNCLNTDQLYLGIIWTSFDILHTVLAPLQAAACVLFTAVYNQERLILQTIYVVNKEILQFLGLKCAVYT